MDSSPGMLGRRSPAATSRAVRAEVASDDSEKARDKMRFTDAGRAVQKQRRCFTGHLPAATSLAMRRTAKRAAEFQWDRTDPVARATPRHA